MEFVLLEVANFFKQLGDRVKFAAFVCNLDDDPQTTVLPVESTSFRRGLELSPLALISSGR